MFRIENIQNTRIASVVFALAMFALPLTAHAWTYKVLHAFTGVPNDGSIPYGALIKDAEGNLYGTTWEGGEYNCGTVFELAPGGTLTVLHSFNYRYQNDDGCGPYAGVVTDDGGNLYGTTGGGGAYGQGAVFELAPDGTETTLHSFQYNDPNNGADPLAGVVRDRRGNLYGTTINGGAGNCWDYTGYGCGIVYRIKPDGTFVKLHDFSENDKELWPIGGLVRDKDGNLYGTTGGGGIYPGTVFKLGAHRTETILYAFGGQPDGAAPSASLIRDGAGNLFGTTFYGGAKNNKGTVFTVGTDDTERVLYSFSGGNDGGSPEDATLLEDKAGNIYGTAPSGGANGGGVVFELAPDGTYTVLHSFSCAKDGCEPVAGLMKDGAGNLYGTALYGGKVGLGTVFELVK